MDFKKNILLVTLFSERDKLGICLEPIWGPHNKLNEKFRWIQEGKKVFRREQAREGFPKAKEIWLSPVDELGWFLQKSSEAKEERNKKIEKFMIIIIKLIKWHEK